MSTTTVHFVDRSTTVRFPVAAISSIAIESALSNYIGDLVAYNSNEAAILGGLVAGDSYKAGSAHVAAPQGVILTVI